MTTLKTISDILISKEIETEENEEIKQLFNEALELESKVKALVENEEFVKDEENISKLMTVSLICSRIGSATHKLVKDKILNSLTGKNVGGEKDGE